MKHLVLPHTNMVDEVYEEMVQAAKAAGIQVIYFERGNQLKAGSLTLTCLHPYFDFSADDRNAYSTVLELTYGTFEMLLTGDVNDAGEKSMLSWQDFGTYQYDVLKVAHHGSKYSTSTEWLSCIKPKYAIISCGRDNRYGHPHEELLKRLDDYHVARSITAESGAIQMKVENDEMKILSFCEKNKVRTCTI